MKRIFLKSAIAIGISLSCLMSAYANMPNTQHPITSLGPTLRLGMTHPLSDVTAFSILGELGDRNLRINGTAGWKLSAHQSLKISADLLRQNIDYPFFSGNTFQWVNQMAFGGYYEYDFANRAHHPIFNLSAYVSHAPSVDLSPLMGTCIENGVLHGYTDYRRIAGSNASGISPGLRFEAWRGAQAGVEINYDDVRYDKIYSPSEDAIGFGSTVRLDQAITDTVKLGLSAAIRKPFDNYQAGLGWTEFKNWSFGVDGSYTAGKNTLPSTYNVTFSANYLLEKNASPATTTYMFGPTDTFSSWVAQPAIYMPQVLAIPDERVVLVNCTTSTPSVLTTIPTHTNNGGTTTFATASAFSPSSGLTFSISLSAPLVGGNNVTINPVTGIVTVTNGGLLNQTLTATITASNTCGSASTTNTIDIIAD